MIESDESIAVVLVMAVVVVAIVGGGIDENNEDWYCYGYWKWMLWWKQC